MLLSQVQSIQAISKCIIQNTLGLTRHALWGLPYFKDLLCPHNIDMMHTEKNIAEALFGTLFGIDGKSKDNTKARVNLEALCDRPLQNMKEPKGKQS